MTERCSICGHWMEERMQYGEPLSIWYKCVNPECPNGKETKITYGTSTN